ncbi:MAG: Crp/Fnr family transcriptional regulator [Desulfobacteraceae bacterium]|nr:Crp/Fnr family transcriptional regulator [Desulfobacteraceae bacterium]
MVENDILKKIFFLNDLSHDILEKIGGIAQLQIFDEETTLFRQNQKQTLLYMLVKGKVFLNSRSEHGHSLTLDEVLSGRTFGVSALFGEDFSTFTAVCVEESQIVTISGEQMLNLFEQDHQVGYALMGRIVQLFKARKDKHTRQFLNTLATHPEMQKLR